MSLGLNEIPITRPITDLRTKLNEVCTLATETCEPIVLTKNGTASYVLQDCASYNQNLQDQRLYLALREAEIEEKYRPASISHEQVEADMQEVLAALRAIPSSASTPLVNARSAHA